jgi:hypothetical protein
MTRITSSLVSHINRGVGAIRCKNHRKYSTSPENVNSAGIWAVLFDLAGRGPVRKVFEGAVVVCYQ